MKKQGEQRMNSIIKFSLKNASVLVMVTILVAIVGLVASSSIKQELLPDIRFPVITVITPYPLAGPEIVEAQVTQPIENALQGIADLEGISSTSSPNISVVVLEFAFSANLNEKEAQVQQAVNRVRGNFPEGVQDPNIGAIRFGDTPVMRLALSSNVPITQLKEKVDNGVLPKLESVTGVSRIDVTGAPKAQIRVTLDEAKLSKYRLDANAINQALRASSLALPVGSIQNNGLNVPVKLDSVAQSVASLAGVVVTAQPDSKALERLGSQAAQTQIAAARAQAQAVQGVAQLASTALQTAGQALGQAGAARGIATGAAQAAGQAVQVAGQAAQAAGQAARAAGQANALAGQALGQASAADAKASRALKAVQGLTGEPVQNSPEAAQAGTPSLGNPPAGAPPAGALAGGAPGAPGLPSGQTMMPPSGAQAPGGFQLPNGAFPGGAPAGAIPSAAPGIRLPQGSSAPLSAPGSGFAGTPPSFGAAPSFSSASAPSFGGAPTGGPSFGSSAGAGVPLVPVTLAEVAKIELTTEDPKSYTRLNGTSAVGLSIFKTQQANTLGVANEVTKKLPELEKAFGGKITVMLDQGEPIAKGVSSLIKEGVLGGFFAVMVVLVFLGNVRSTLITAISIPLSILVGLLMLSLQGFTLNVLTLGGLTIAIGRVIDDAIVVIENVYHRLALGDSPLKAAYEGAREVAAPVTASTITTVAVFLPLAFVGGIAGEFFRPLALAVTYSILASLIVAFTIIPLFSSLFLKSAPPQAIKASAIERLYRRAITWATANRILVLVGAVVLFFASSALVARIPTNFVGGGEASTAEISLKLKDGTRLSQVNANSKLIETKLEALREEGVLKSYQTVVGGADNPIAVAFGGGTGAATSFTVLPGEQNGRKVAIRETLVPRLEEALKDAVPGGEISVVAGAGTGGFAQSLEVQLQASDTKTLRTAANQVLEAVKNVPEVRNPKSNLDAVNPEFVVNVDQKKAFEKGIIPVTVGGTVRQALQGTSSIALNINEQSVGVLLTAPRGTYDTLENLKKLKLRPAQGGDSVPSIRSPRSNKCLAPRACAALMANAPRP
jgi:multidrug efflux pump subunit AcrB